jgi:hypothetical protein
MLKSGGRLVIQATGAARSRAPALLPLRFILRSFAVARVHIRMLGLAGTLRYLAYRLNPARLVAQFRARGMARDELAQMYRVSLPGCTLNMDRVNYVVGWAKPEDVKSAPAPNIL